MKSQDRERQKRRINHKGCMHTLPLLHPTQIDLFHRAAVFRSRLLFILCSHCFRKKNSSRNINKISSHNNVLSSIFPEHDTMLPIANNTDFCIRMIARSFCYSFHCVDSAQLEDFTICKRKPFSVSSLERCRSIGLPEIYTFISFLDILLQAVPMEINYP